MLFPFILLIALSRHFQPQKAIHSLYFSSIDNIDNPLADFDENGSSTDNTEKETASELTSESTPNKKEHSDCEEEFYRFFATVEKLHEYVTIGTTNPAKYRSYATPNEMMKQGYLPLSELF